MIDTLFSSHPTLETRTSPMPLIAQPWTRVRTPVPIPAGVTAEVLSKLEPVAFAELLRSNLNPADPSNRARAAWSRLWQILHDDEGLTERTYDVLEEFQDLTDEALDGSELDDAARKRAEKFARACDASWQRIDRVRPQPLSWAADADKFNPNARRVIATMVSAIAHHRAVVVKSDAGPRPEDDDLWHVLRRLNLDPRDYAPRATDR